MTSSLPPLSYSGFGLPALHTHPRPSYPRRRQSPYLYSSSSSSPSTSSLSSSSSDSSSAPGFVTAVQSRSSSSASSSRTPSPTPTPRPTVIVRTCRRTPYYPPNSSRTADNKGRVYMPRGPHYVANWTPMSTLSRGSQDMVEERMVLSLLF